MKKSINTPPTHPPGDEPKITNEQRQHLLDKPRPEAEEVRDLTADLRRAQRKPVWAYKTKRADAEDREYSATATAEAILMKLEDLAQLGGAHRRMQQQIAKGERSPLNPLLREYRMRNPHDTSEDAWDALPAWSNDEVTIRVVDGVMEVDLHPSDPQDRRKPKSFDVKRNSFRSAFSRAKPAKKPR